MADKKICYICTEEKTIDDFNYNRYKRDKRQSRCRECQRATSKNHYINNTAYYLEKNKLRYRAAREYIRSRKNDPCMDCGIKYPYYVMHFDHRDPMQKSYEISRMAKTIGTIDVIKNEIEKTDLVCANCHAVRSHQRGYGKRKPLQSRVG